MRDRSPLDEIRIASPCPASWDEMPGDDRRRHCSGCDRDVYDLSALTADAALALVAAPGPRPCVRFFRRADGTMLTADCPVGAQAVRRRRRWEAAALGVGAAILAAVAAAIGPRRDVAPARQAATSSANPEAESAALVAEIEAQHAPTRLGRAAAVVQEWVARGQDKLGIGDDDSPTRPTVTLGTPAAPPVPLDTHMTTPAGLTGSVVMGMCPVVEPPPQPAAPMNAPPSP